MPKIRTWRAALKNSPLLLGIALCIPHQAKSKTPLGPGARIQVFTLEQAKVREFKLGSLLGHGSKTNVFAIKDNPQLAFRALRFEPNNNASFEKATLYKNSFFNG